MTTLRIRNVAQQSCLTFEYLYQIDHDFIYSEYEIQVLDKSGEVLLLLEADCTSISLILSIVHTSDC